MKQSNNSSRRVEKGFFKLIENFTESIGWLLIAASPILLGIIIGGILYLSYPTTTFAIIGCAIAIAGLAIGCIYANKQLKNKGTVWFISRVMATPELDQPNGIETPREKQ